MAEDKIKVGIYIDRKLWQEFRQIIFQKYGELYGTVSTEIESMMKNWLAAHTNLTNKPSKLNPLGSRTERLARKITEWVQSKTDTFQVHRRLIIKAIEEERGSDPRTVKKWFNYLRRHGYVKPLGGDMWEIL